MPLAEFFREIASNELEYSVAGFDGEDREWGLRALKQANGNRKVTAELLGTGRTTLYSKLEE